MRSLRGSKAVAVKQEPPPPVPAPPPPQQPQQLHESEAEYDPEDDAGSVGGSSMGGGGGGGGSGGTSSSTGNATQCPGSRDQPLFLRKTYQMLEASPPDIAEWSAKGDSFTIKDPDRFAQTVIPQYFSHSNFSSFVRQLNFYGFRKVKQDMRALQGSSTGSVGMATLKDTTKDGKDTNKWWEFRHDKFLRGKPQLLSQIRRATHGASNEQEVSHLKSEVGQLKDRINEMSSDIDRLTSLVNGLMLDKMDQGAGSDPKKRKVSADRAVLASAAVMAALRRPQEGEEADEEEEEDEAGHGLLPIKSEFGCGDSGGVDLDLDTTSTDTVLAFDGHGHLFLGEPDPEDGGKLAASAFEPFLDGGEEEEETAATAVVVDGDTASSRANGPMAAAGGEEDFAFSYLNLGGGHGEETPQQAQESAQPSLMETSPPNSPRMQAVPKPAAVAASTPVAAPLQQPQQPPQDLSALHDSLATLSPDHKKRLVETLVMALGPNTPTASAAATTTSAPTPLPSSATAAATAAGVPPLASAAFGAFLTQYAKELVEKEKPTQMGHHHGHGHTTRKAIRSQG